MLKNFEQYLLENLFLSLLLILGIFFVSFSIVQIGEIIKNTSSGAKISSIIKLIPLTFPIFLFYFSFPASLLAIFITTVRMHKKNELLILKASGISVRPIARTVSFFLTIILLINFYNIFYLLPAAKFKLTRETLRLVKNSTVSLLQKEGFTIIERKIAILVKKQGEKTNVLLFSDKNSLPIIIGASDISYKNDRIRFQNGVIIPFKDHETNTILKFERGIIPPSLLLPVKSKYGLSRGELRLSGLIEAFFKDPANNFINVELNRRLIFAFAPIFVGWIGLLPYGLKRGKEYWNYILPSILAFLSFYILTSTGRNMLYHDKPTGTIVMWSALFTIFIINEIAEIYVRKRQ